MVSSSNGAWAIAGFFRLQVGQLCNLERLFGVAQVRVLVRCIHIGRAASEAGGNKVWGTIWLTVCTSGTTQKLSCGVSTTIEIKNLRTTPDSTGTLVRQNMPC